MSDQDPSLTPAQDQEVRRLLADARHDEPMPQDVASRLERVLAQLAAGDPQLGPGTIVELASRRRRRAASLLIAAAAVVAVGIGLGQVVGPGNSGANTASSDSVGRDAPDAANEAGAEAASPDPANSSLAGADSLDLSFARSSPIKIRSEHFATDVEHARRAAAVLRTTAGYLAPIVPSGDDQTDGQAELDSSAVSAGTVPWFECTPANFGKGQLIPVLYDGESAVLALRRAVGDTQVAELLQCGSGEILRSTTLRSTTLPTP